MGLTEEQVKRLLDWFSVVNRVAGGNNAQRAAYFRLSLFPAMAAGCRQYGINQPAWLTSIVGEKPGPRVLLVRKAHDVSGESRNKKGEWTAASLFGDDPAPARAIAADAPIHEIPFETFKKMFRFDIVKNHAGKEVKVQGHTQHLAPGNVGVLTGARDKDGSTRQFTTISTDKATAYREAHRAAVEDAVKHGKKVPDDVLADYPQFKAQRPNVQPNLFGDDLFKGIMVLLVRRVGPFDAYLNKAVDDDHINIRRKEVAACKKHEDEPCDIAGLGGLKYPGYYCKKCGSVRMKHKRHHGFTSAAAPLAKAFCTSDWRPGQMEKAVAEGCYRNPGACGLRWITCHPNGEEPGVPLLVHDNGEEYTVVGGAGGKMNQQVFKKPLVQRDFKSAIVKEKRLAKKSARIAEMGEDAEKARETAKQLRELANQKTQDALSQIMAKIHGSMSGDEALARVQDEARKRAIKENPNASEEEQNEFADTAANAAVTEAKDSAKNALNQILDKSALQAIGDDVNQGADIVTAAQGKQIIRHMSADELNDIIGLVAQSAQAKGEARAIQRALQTGDQDAIQGIEADVQPLSMEEAHQRNLDRYLHDKDVDNQTALVTASNASPEKIRNRNMANGAMDGLNSLTASMTGQACLRPELTKALGVEDSARVVAAYLEDNGIDTANTAEGLRDRIGAQSASSVAATIDKIREMDAMVTNAKDAAHSGDGAVTVGQASILAANMANMKYRFLNITRGQLRSAAALAHHLEHPSHRPLSIHGGTSATSAHALAKGFGLDDGDYAVEKSERGTGGGYKVIVQPDKIAKLASSHSLAESERNFDMDNLRQDVEENHGDWHPDGLSTNIMLQQHQELGARAAIQQKRVILNFGAGSGKTATYYAAAAGALAQGKVDRVLMTMPSSVKAQQLDYTDEETGEKKQGEAEKFLTPDLRGQTMVADSSNWKKVLAAVKDGTCKIMVATPDMLRNHAKELEDAGFGGERSMYIADEAHKLAIGEGEGAGSGMAQAADKLAKSEYFIAGSGTLIENNASELFSTLERTRPGEFGSQKRFTQQWQRLAQGGGDLFSSESMKGMRDRLSGVMLTYHKPVEGPSGEALENEENTVTVKTTPLQKSEIKKINEKYEKDRRNPDPSIKKAAALGRDAAIFRVLTRGVKRKDGSIENPKLDALADIMASEKKRDKKGRIGIYSREIAPLRVAKSYLKGHNIMSLTGEQSDDQKRAAINSANDRNSDCDGIDLSDTGATGVNLYGLDHMVLMHGTMTPSLYEQIVHRHFRKGATTNKRSTVILTDALQEQYRNWRVKHVKKSESDLLTQLADDHGYAGVLAKHLPAIEETAGETLNA